MFLHITYNLQAQFSSSPIRDVSRTPREAEAQNDLFSNSPLLSPILYRSVSFPPPPQSDVNKTLDFLRSHANPPPSPDLSQSMIVGDDGSGELRQCEGRNCFFAISFHTLLILRYLGGGHLADWINYFGSFAYRPHGWHSNGWQCVESLHPTHPPQSPHPTHGTHPGSVIIRLWYGNRFPTIHRGETLC